MSARLRGPLRLLLAALILVAVGRTFVYSWATLGAMPNLFNFFGFFTVQSNLLAAAVLLLLGGHDLTGRAQPGWLPVARGCVTVYVIIVGIVYAVLLAPLGEAGGVPIAWANTVLHIISPILMPVGWLVFRDRPPSIVAEGDLGSPVPPIPDTGDPTPTPTPSVSAEPSAFPTTPTRPGVPSTGW